jgi:O-antigen/teichoic acid export membrane protein
MTTFGAIADQGLFAISGMVISLLLARWLSPSEYGIFVLGYSSFWLYGTVHAAFFLQPLIVLGSGRYRDSFPAYVAALLKTHWQISMLVSVFLVILGILAWLLHAMPLAFLFWCFSITGPIILFQEILRRTSYPLKAPHLASYAGAMYFLVVIMGSSILCQMNVLSATSALGLLGVGSFFSAIWLLSQLKLGNAQHEEPISPSLILRTHWAFGKWNIGASVCAWTLANIYYFILSWQHGLEDTAALKALLLIFMPILHTIVAIPRVLTVRLVREKDSINFTQTVRSVLFALGMGSALYAILVSHYRQPIVSWLFNGQFDAYVDQLWLIGIIPILLAISSVLGATLQAWERPDVQFYTLLFSVLLSLPIGFLLTKFFGLTGAITGMILSYLMSTVHLYVHWHRLAASPQLTIQKEVYQE